MIRPDILLTEDGLKITELDSVPGGIGLTAWLNRTYTEAGTEVLGSTTGMLDGFAGIFGDAKQIRLIVSEESATYRPEMEWLAGQIAPERMSVHGQEFTGFTEGDAVYRFFELFDLPNIPAADEPPTRHRPDAHAHRSAEVVPRGENDLRAVPQSQPHRGVAAATGRELQAHARGVAAADVGDRPLTDAAARRPTPA